MTLSSLRSAKCSGVLPDRLLLCRFATFPPQCGGIYPSGERLLRESYDTVLAVGTVSAPYTAKKSRTEKKVLYEVYAVRRKQNMTMNRKIEKLYRTALFCKKTFLCCRVDKGFDAHKAAHPAATGQIDVVGGFEVQTDSVLADF